MKSPIHELLINFATRTRLIYRFKGQKLIKQPLKEGFRDQTARSATKRVSRLQMPDKKISQLTRRQIILSDDKLKRLLRISLSFLSLAISLVGQEIEKGI